MPGNNELFEYGKTELLNIFTEENDQKGTDILSMSDFFSIFIDRIEVDMDLDTAWEVYQNIEGFIGEIGISGSLSNNRNRYTK